MRGFDRYRSSQVRSASKVELVQMLFQEASKRLSIAGDLPTGSSARIAHLHHVREIYTELELALDFDAAPEFCAQMQALYTWCITTLIRSANGERADTELAGVIRVTDSLAEGWFQAARQPEARSA